MDIIPGTNFFAPLNGDVNISQTNEFGFAVLADCYGNPNVVADIPGVFNTGCLMIRNDILTGQNLYVNQGTIASPSWVLVGSGSGGGGVSLGGSQTGFTDGMVQYITQDGLQGGDTNFTRDSTTQDTSIITDFGTGKTGGLITSHSFAPVGGEPATFFYYGATPASGSQTNGVFAIIDDTAGMLGTNDPALVFNQSNNANGSQVGVNFSGLNGYGVMQYSSNVSPVVAQVTVQGSTHGNVGFITDQDGYMYYQDSSGNNYLIINGMINPFIAMGDLSGIGNRTQFQLNDAFQTFDFRGFGNVSTDRIALFNNSSRNVKLGDVDFDWDGTLLTIDDIGNTIFAGAIASSALGDTGGNPWVQASPSAGNAKLGDINDLYSGDKIIVQTQTLGGGGTTVYTGNGNTFIVEDLATGNESVYVNYNQQIKLGDLAGSASNMVMDIDQSTNIWTMQNYGPTNFQSSTVGNPLWMTIQPYNNYVAMGDLSGTNNLNSFIIDDSSDEIISSTDTFFFNSAGGTNDNIGYILYNAGSPQIGFGDFALTGNGTQLALSDVAQNFQITNNTVAGNQEGFLLDFANSIYQMGATGWGNNTNFTINDTDEEVNVVVEGGGLLRGSGFNILDTSSNVWFNATPGDHTVGFGDLSNSFQKTTFVLSDGGQNIIATVPSIFNINDVNSDGWFSTNTTNHATYIGDLSGAYNSNFAVFDDLNELSQLSFKHIQFPQLSPYANNAAAIAGGLGSGDAYLVTDVTTGSYQMQIVM